MDDGLVESAHGGGQSRKEEATGPGNGSADTSSPTQQRPQPNSNAAPTLFQFRLQSQLFLPTHSFSAAPPMMFSASAASSSSIRCPWLLLLLLALMAALLQSANAQAPLDQQIAAAEKRSPPAVRNPYSWMAAADVETDKRSALRRPQNPYSWMAANEEPGTGQWTLSRLRPFQALMAKRLTGSSGGSRTGPSRNPYSWTNF